MKRGRAMDAKVKNKVRRLAKKHAERKGLGGPFTYAFYAEDGPNADWVTIDSHSSSAYVSAQISVLLEGAAG